MRRPGDLELRRVLAVTAGVLIAAATVFPVWRITLTAPQYPGQDLIVKLYAYPRLGGDFEEVQALNSYVGFYYPDPVLIEPNYAVHEMAIATPEWTFGPVLFVGAGLLCVAFAWRLHDDTIGRRLRQLAGGYVVMFALVAGLAQYRLHQAGHSLDPGAPLRGVDAFTPPLIGSYEIANISGDAWLATGGYLMITGLVLLIAAAVIGHQSTTLAEAIAWGSARLDRVKSRAETQPGESLEQR